MASAHASTPADARDPGYRWVVIAQLWLHQVLTLAAVSGLGVLLVGMQADLHFGTIEAGWLGAARTAGQFLTFPLSFLAVRLAPKRTYSVLVAAMTAAILAGGLAPGYWLLLGSQVAFSVALALSQVPATMLRVQWVPPREMARVWGIGNALSAVAQSATLAVVPAAVVLLGGWRPVFEVTGALLAVAVIGWWLTARERPGHAFSAPTGTARFRALRRREFYILGLTITGGGTAYTTAILFLPLYFVGERGFSLAEAGSITAILPAAGLLSNLSAGFLSDRTGRRKVFIWPCGLILPGLYLLALSPLPLWGEAVVVFALGYFAWFPFPVLMAIPYELPGIEAAEVAVGQALVQAVSGAGILAGPVVASIVADATGSYGAGLLALSGLPILFALGCLVLPETGPAARRREAAAATAEA
ncbi:MAG: MFS transporter [Dehalococcoidia bacterium]